MGVASTFRPPEPVHTAEGRRSQHVDDGEILSRYTVGMSRALFRLLLCLSLVLNGTGYAVASTQMQIAHWGMAVDTAAKAAKPPCHDAGEQASHDAGAAAMNDGTAASSHGDQSGCCQSALCTCDCLQHATAAGVFVAMSTSLQPADYTSSLREARAAAPPLHNLLRPPIA